MTKKSKNGIDLQEYGAMSQKIDDVSIRLDKFIENEFHHLVNKVDWMFVIAITALVGLAANLTILLLK